jgi:hypothetical protein
MKTLTQYGSLALEHWKQFLPRMVEELERKGALQELLLEAERKTASELDDLRQHFRQQGLTAEQAHHRAWEVVRARYIFLPPEP